jgi:hypothetical protein
VLGRGGEGELARRRDSEEAGRRPAAVEAGSG